MREYLTCGIAKRIVIRSEDEQEDKETILERIGQNIDLNLYNRIDDEEYIILNIKKDIFEKNVHELIDEQTKRFYMNEYEKIFIGYQLKDLKNMKYEEILKYFNIKRGDSVTNNISYLDSTGKCVIYCDLLEFFGTGDTFFECYNDIFTYFRNCIINSSKNAIRTSMVITMTS